MDFFFNFDYLSSNFFYNIHRICLQRTLFENPLVYLFIVKFTAMIVLNMYRKYSTLCSQMRDPMTKKSHKTARSGSFTSIPLNASRFGKFDGLAFCRQGVSI